MRPALAAQFTGLNRAIPAIQPGTSASDRKAPDRNVRGITSVEEKPISVSRCRVSSAIASESPAIASEIRTATPSSARIPESPPKRAPIAQPISMMITELTTVMNP